jgi:hypothetical protein
VCRERNAGGQEAEASEAAAAQQTCHFCRLLKVSVENSACVLCYTGVSGPGSRQVGGEVAGLQRIEWPGPH